MKLSLLTLYFLLSTSYADDEIRLWKDETGKYHHRQIDNSSQSSKGFNFSIDKYQYNDIDTKPIGKQYRWKNESPEYEQGKSMSGKVYINNGHIDKCVITTKDRDTEINCFR